jgi:hypothetical protein
MRTIFVNDFNLCHYPQPAYCKSNMTGVLSKSGTTYPSHATISRRLVSEIHHPGLSVTFITPACQWHPSPRLVSDIHHPGLSVTSITPACQWHPSPRLVSDIHHPGFSVRSVLFIFLALCLSFCLSSSCVVCVQCCQCLWIVHSWLSFRFSLMFIYWLIVT